jgi:sRNA-binding protein
MFTERKLPKEILEEGIRTLAERYPACFSEDPRQRRPLKNTIRADLKADGVDEETMACVDYYIRNWTYQGLLQAGAERVDLNGKKAGVVTEQEQLAAQKKVRDEKEKLAAGRIPADIPLMRTPTVAKTKTAPSPAPEFTPPANGVDLAALRATWSDIDAVLATAKGDTLRSALAVAALKVFVGEAEKVIASLEGGAGT